MKRVALSDGNGLWFDADKAEFFKEETYFNGSNHISKATGDQFEHEAIYITKSGKFILNHWSNWQGKGESYTEISKEEAARLFARQSIKD